MNLELPGRKNRKQGMEDFSKELESIGDQIGFKLSARGWCYQLEGFGLITKAEFNKAENIINACRKQGYLPIDFTAEEEGRQFAGVERPDTISTKEHLANVLSWVLDCEDMYTPDWWEGEDYYIQLIVEKIDLKTLFSPVCEDYHIPIATSKGWSSMRQRAEYARRFRKAEKNGLQCVLLYCGDHDPDGLRISDFLRSNLDDLKDIYWEGGYLGYDPKDLIIDRFGLNYDFIQDNNLSWINNLITGSKKNLASPSHPNFDLPYLQNYLQDIGERKCEANALVVTPREAEGLVRSAIEGYLGPEAIERFEIKRAAIDDEISDLRNEYEINELIERIQDDLA